MKNWRNHLGIIVPILVVAALAAEDDALRAGGRWDLDSPGTSLQGLREGQDGIGQMRGPAVAGETVHVAVGVERQRIEGIAELRPIH